MAVFSVTSRRLRPQLPHPQHTCLRTSADTLPAPTRAGRSLLINFWLTRAAHRPAPASTPLHPRPSRCAEMPQSQSAGDHLRRDVARLNQPLRIVLLGFTVLQDLYVELKADHNLADLPQKAVTTILAALKGCHPRGKMVCPQPSVLAAQVQFELKKNLQLASGGRLDSTFPWVRRFRPELDSTAKFVDLAWKPFDFRSGSHARGPRRPLCCIVRPFLLFCFFFLFSPSIPDPSSFLLPFRGSLVIAGVKIETSVSFRRGSEFLFCNCVSSPAIGFRSRPTWFSRTRAVWRSCLQQLNLLGSSKPWLTAPQWLS